MKISKSEPEKQRTRDNIKQASLPSLLEWTEASGRAIRRLGKEIEHQVWILELLAAEIRKRCDIEPNKAVRVERFNKDTERFEPCTKEAPDGQHD